MIKDFVLCFQFVIIVILVSFIVYFDGVSFPYDRCTNSPIIHDGMVYKCTFKPLSEVILKGALDEIYLD